MATRLRLEKFLVTFFISNSFNPVSQAWLLRRREIHMHVTNLRNRPLTADQIDSLGQCIPPLYGQAIGDPQFHRMNHHGFLYVQRLESPFPRPVSNWENAPPSPLTEGPAAVMVQMAGSSSSSRGGSLVTAGHPDKADLATLRADTRNQLWPMVWRDAHFTRVISTVRHRATREMMDPERPPSQRKRKAREDESSTLLPAKKTLRL